MVVLLQLLPLATTAAARKAVDSFAERWHLEHYDMDVDIATRDADSTVQHLSFLYGVRDGSASDKHVL